MLVRLTTAVSAIAAAIQKKCFGSGTTALKISDEEIDGVMKIVKSFEESGLLVKDVSETIKKEAKEQMADSLLLGKVGASLLRKILEGSEVARGGGGIT